MKAEAGQLRLYDPKTGKRLLTPAEVEAARREAEVGRREAQAEAKKELAARQNAEAEIIRLRAELAKFQAPSSLS